VPSALDHDACRYQVNKHVSQYLLQPHKPLHWHRRAQNSTLPLLSPSFLRPAPSLPPFCVPARLTLSPPLPEKDGPAVAGGSHGCDVALEGGEKRRQKKSVGTRDRKHWQAGAEGQGARGSGGGRGDTRETSTSSSATRRAAASIRGKYVQAVSTAFLTRLLCLWEYWTEVTRR